MTSNSGAGCACGDVGGKIYSRQALLFLEYSALTRVVQARWDLGLAQVVVEIKLTG